MFLKLQLVIKPTRGLTTHPAGEYWIIQAKDIDRNRNIDWNNLIRFQPVVGAKRIEELGDILFLARGRENYALVIDRHLEHFTCG